MKRYLCDHLGCCNESDWTYVGFGEADHTVCDACFAELGEIDPELQLEYEPLLVRDYSEYEL